MSEGRRGGNGRPCWLWVIEGEKISRVGRLWGIRLGTLGFYRGSSGLSFLPFPTHPCPSQSRPFFISSARPPPVLTPSFPPFSSILQGGYAHPLSRSWQTQGRKLRKEMLMYPIFISDDDQAEQVISSLPRQKRWGVDRLEEVCFTLLSHCCSLQANHYCLFFSSWALWSRRGCRR